MNDFKSFVLGEGEEYLPRLNDITVLPPDTIPGWKVKFFPERSKLNYTRTFLFVAVRLDYHYPQRTVFTKKMTVSEETLAVDRDVVMRELKKRAIYELKEEVIKWMMNNDESILALQRVLSYGLNSSYVLK